MNNTELVDEIEKWNTIFVSDVAVNASIYELAFFRIFVKFEKFLSDAFEHYAVGNSSSYGYSPKRRLHFDDLSHLKKVIQKENGFVSDYKLIIDKSDCFFIDNPFEIIKTDSLHVNTIADMKFIRDYMAHESESARSKYVTRVLNGGPFVEPHIHLSSLKRGVAESYYTFYIKSIREISDYIINAQVSSEGM